MVDKVIEKALSDKKVVDAINGRAIVKIIYVPDKLINIVTEESHG